MISTDKKMNIRYNNTSNPLSSTTDTLYSRKGYSDSSSSPTVPIYFYRYIGIPKPMTGGDFKTLIKDNLSIYNKERINHVVFNNHIPADRSPSFILENFNEINRKHNGLQLKDIDLYLKDLLEHKLLKKPNNSYVKATCESALYALAKKYISEEPHVNITKTRNFILKIFTWSAQFLPSLLQGFTYSSKYNPKVIYIGDIKKHEQYFLLYLARVGCDVIYINPSKDLTTGILSDSMLMDGLTRQLNLDDIVGNSKPATKRATTPPVKNSTRPSTSLKESISNRPNTRANTTPRPPVQPKPQEPRRKSTINTTRIRSLDITKINHTINRESTDLFKEVLLPLDKRVGFNKDTYCTIPRYFYRILGVDDNINVYKNRLYNLDKDIGSNQTNYIRFDREIRLEPNNDLVNSTKNLWSSIKSETVETKKIIDLLYSYDCFKLTNNNVFNTTIASSLAYVLDAYRDTNKNVSIAQIKNFTLKILSWAHKYIPKLFDYSYDFSKPNNPKVIYFGDIKKHEGLFLVFLSMLGSDVIYINPLGVDKFSWIPTIGSISHKKANNLTKDIKDYPSTEVLIRSETVAYQASREIGDILHNTDDGLFRPWQFEDYMIQPLTLKTTYDEVFILWKEPPRVRSGFQVKNGTVYVPNIFCKVSGTHEDMQQYWRELQDAVNYEFTHYEENVPFTNIGYEDGQMYAYDYLINRDGTLNKVEVKKSSLYTYGYLKQGLQDTILDKIEQLFKYDGFKHTVDRAFKKRILKNILCLDKHIISLLNKFDYPMANPKLVVYDKDESMFSTDDIIIMLFLNLMCFDIVIFTPTGYNNIERDINQNKFDIHKLQINQFNLAVPPRLLNPNTAETPKKAKSLWSSFFGN